MCPEGEENDFRCVPSRMLHLLIELCRFLDLVLEMVSNMRRLQRVVRWFGKATNTNMRYSVALHDEHLPRPPRLLAPTKRVFSTLTIHFAKVKNLCVGWNV
jgi:hypothetical protein